MWAVATSGRLPILNESQSIPDSRWIENGFFGSITPKWYQNAISFFITRGRKKSAGSTKKRSPSPPKLSPQKKTPSPSKAPARRGRPLGSGSKRTTRCDTNCVIKTAPSRFHLLVQKFRYHQNLNIDHQSNVGWTDDRPWQRTLNNW